MEQKIPYDYQTGLVNINVRGIEIRFIDEAIKELQNSFWIHPPHIMFIQTNQEQSVRVVSNMWQVTLIMDFRDINWDMSMAILEMRVRLNKVTTDFLDENDIWNLIFYANGLVEKQIKAQGLHTKDGELFKLPSFSFSSEQFVGVVGSPISVIKGEDNNMFAPPQ